MNSHSKPSKPFARMIRRFVSAKNSYRTTRNRRHLLGFESLESRRVLCDAMPIVTEAPPVQLMEVYGAVQLAQIPQAPPQGAVVAPIGFAPISSVDRLPSTNDSIFASELAIQQILPSIAELGPYELGPANSDVNYFGEGEDPVPVDPSTNPPPPTNPPPGNPSGGTGGGTQSNTPPTITLEYQRDEDAWAFLGTVVDDKSTQGLVVTFGGLLRGSSTTVDSSGHFLFVTTLPAGSRGFVTAQTTDVDGAASNIATIII